ncbi:MAG: phosphate ABC transporter substrate-binding protein PstS [Actinomycetes bacterium]
MKRFPLRRLSHIVRVLAVGVAMGLLVLIAPEAATASDNLVPISGAGSTWSQVAIDAWRADVRPSGLTVNYAGTGSTDGRAQYIQKTVDFAVSEIPFQNPPEPGQQAENPSRPYAYLPIVAGGTSFMYHLTVGGELVRNLKLSSGTLAKIFTGQITRWSDPQITKENGRRLPDIPIIPVLRSDGAGASAQFSRYLSKTEPDIYCPWARSKLHQPSNWCGFTSFYPSFGNSKGQVGSNGVANYIAASYGDGAIGYVEYAYAKRLNYPVASVLNQAKYFTQPTASNVAVALTRAKIDPKTLVQNLDGVYTNPDKRTYPLSSYSYMIVPTSTAEPFNTDKGKSLSTFINYFLCAGQQKAEILGYSPLPENLVTAGFKQVARIPGGVKSPALSSCNNPALQILKTAPYPDECSKLGAPASCVPGSGGSGDPNDKNGQGTGGTGTTQNGTTTGTGTTTNGDGSGAVDEFGQPIASGTTTGAMAPAVASAVTVGEQRQQFIILGLIAAAAVLAAVLTPPLLARRHRRRRGTAPQQG